MNIVDVRTLSIDNKTNHSLPFALLFPSSTCKEPHSRSFYIYTQMPYTVFLSLNLRLQNLLWTTTVAVSHSTWSSSRCFHQIERTDSSESPDLNSNGVLLNIRNIASDSRSWTLSVCSTAMKSAATLSVTVSQRVLKWYGRTPIPNHLLREL